MNSRGYLPNFPPRPPECNASVSLLLSILVGPPIYLPRLTQSTSFQLDSMVQPILSPKTRLVFMARNLSLKTAQSASGDPLMAITRRTMCLCHRKYSMLVSDQCCQLFSRFFGRARQKKFGRRKTVVLCGKNYIFIYRVKNQQRWHV